MAKINKEEFIAAIKEMSVLELNELVKAIEEEFGVTAAAPVAVVAGGAAAGAGYEVPAENFVGPSAAIFSQDEVTGCKIVFEFLKGHEKLTVKGGVVDSQIMTVNELKQLSTLPNKDGMISMLLSVMQAPIRGLACAIKAVSEKE